MSSHHPRTSLQASSFLSHLPYLLLKDGDGLAIDDKLPILSLHCAIELAMGGIILEHVDLKGQVGASRDCALARLGPHTSRMGNTHHVVEVNEGVIDGDNIHFTRVKSSPGDQAPNSAKSER